MSKKKSAPSFVKKHDIASRVHALAWAGKHPQAIDLATQELDNATLPTSQRMDLLDLRSESYIAIGKLDLTLQDAKAMGRLAKGGSHQLTAQALNRLALVQMRMGEIKAAVKTASGALKVAHQSKYKPLVALSLFRLSEAQMRTRQSKAAADTAQKAIAIYQKLGDDSGAGRAYWVLASAYFRLNLAEDTRHAAQTALALCEQAGDQYGVGNAFISLSLTDTDLAERIQHTQQALQTFETAGYKDRQAVVLSILALVYGELGLYIRSRRLQYEVIKITRAMGARVSLTYQIANIITNEIILNDLASAHLHLQELATLVPDLGDPTMDCQLASTRAELAFAKGDLKNAIYHYKCALKIDKTAQIGREHIILTELAKAHLAAGNLVAALNATTKATAIHHAQNFAPPDGLSSHTIWWWHVQAFNANQKTEETHEMLGLAYNFLLEDITNIRDVGLRRNYLNKVKDNRELLKYWVKVGIKNKTPKERVYAYLNIESNTREPFTRLTNTSQRLNLLKDIPAIQTFLVEEATELSGAERVMLILEDGENLKVAESILPKNEAAEDVLASVKKYLTQTRLTRTVQLILPNRQGLSRIIAPLVAQNQIIGYLYADMDSIYGLFDGTDRDMLGMLANQAAVALDNAGLVNRLEEKVQERTAQLQESVEETERLLKESRTLGRVGRDISSSLDVQLVLENITSYAKDLLSADMSALFLPEQGGVVFKAVTALGNNAEALKNAQVELGSGILGNIAKTKRAEAINDIGNDPRVLTIPETENVEHEHLLVVPLLADHELRGLMAVWRTGAGQEFSQDELNFLINLSRQAVVALKNAQLFSEAHESRLIAEQANKMKSAFLANMSHELRTPLNAIINFTELVQMGVMGDVNDDQKEALGNSLTSSKHLLQLINDILDISKIQAGKLTLFIDKGVDVHNEIEDALHMVEPLVQKQHDLYGYNVRLVKDIDANLPLINYDRRRVRQVFLNLLTNAIKFTQQGSITLSAKRKKDYLEFAVMDTGPGIPPEMQAKIFEPFLQTEAGVKQVEGTGLGLPITKSLIESHGGRIWLESEPGEGSTFFFTLPIP